MDKRPGYLEADPIGSDGPWRKHCKKAGTPSKALHDAAHVKLCPASGIVGEVGIQIVIARQRNDLVLDKASIGSGMAHEEELVLCLVFKSSGIHRAGSDA